MSAAMSPGDLLGALEEAAAGHDCPTPTFLFDEVLGESVIRCMGCRATIWRERG